MSPGDVIIVIPARHGSTRFPGKPLAPLRGSDGSVRPLIEWTWRAAVRASETAQVVVATDDARIADAVIAFGGDVILTSAHARNGTERCAETLAALPFAPQLAVNLQGDSPLVRAADIAAVIEHWRATGAPMTTAFVTCDAAAEARLLDEQRAGRVGGTCVVTDRAGRALYFSRRVIPHRSGAAPPLKLHLGLYAYTPAALGSYTGWGPSPLEQAEGLEQLRFLEHGLPIDTVELRAPPAGFWEVNHPEDVAVVEAALAAQHAD